MCLSRQPHTFVSSLFHHWGRIGCRASASARGNLPCEKQYGKSHQCFFPRFEGWSHHTACRQGSTSWKGRRDKRLKQFCVGLIHNFACSLFEL